MSWSCCCGQGSPCPFPPPPQGQRDVLCGSVLGHRATGVQCWPQLWGRGGKLAAGSPWWLFSPVGVLGCGHCEQTVHFLGCADMGGFGLDVWRSLPAPILCDSSPFYPASPEAQSWGLAIALLLLKQQVAGKLGRPWLGTLTDGRWEGGGIKPPFSTQATHVWPPPLLLPLEL